jgi:hypothetical protein
MTRVGDARLRKVDAPLDRAGSAKVLFQVIIGTRQIFDLVVVEEPVPITGSDILEVCHCGRECAQPVLLLCHRLQQPLILLLEGGHSTLLGIGEQVSGLVQPGVRLSDRGPKLLRRR